MPFAQEIKSFLSKSNDTADDFFKGYWPLSNVERHISSGAHRKSTSKAECISNGEHGENTNNSSQIEGESENNNDSVPSTLISIPNPHNTITSAAPFMNTSFCGTESKQVSSTQPTKYVLLTLNNVPEYTGVTTNEISKLKTWLKLFIILFILQKNVLHLQKADTNKRLTFDAVAPFNFSALYCVSENQNTTDEVYILTKNPFS